MNPISNGQLSEFSALQGRRILGASVRSPLAPLAIPTTSAAEPELRSHSTKIRKIVLSNDILMRMPFIPRWVPVNGTGSESEIRLTFLMSTAWTVRCDGSCQKSTQLKYQEINFNEADILYI